MDNHADQHIDGCEPAVSEIVGAIDRLAPELLAHLNHEYPKHSELLRLGEELDGNRERGGKRDLDVRLRVTGAFLEEVLPKCHGAVAEIRRRLRKSDMFELGAEVVTVISTSAVLAFLFGQSELGAFISALLALLGSLASLGSRWLRRPPVGSTATLQDHFHDLLLLQADGFELQGEFRVWKEVKGSIRKGQELVERTQEFCRKLNVMLG